VGSPRVASGPVARAQVSAVPADRVVVRAAQGAPEVRAALVVLAVRADPVVRAVLADRAAPAVPVVPVLVKVVPDPCGPPAARAERASTRW
jgi:hypothetical protein